MIFIIHRYIVDTLPEITASLRDAVVSELRDGKSQNRNAVVFFFLIPMAE